MSSFLRRPPCLIIPVSSSQIISPSLPPLFLVSAPPRLFQSLQIPLWQGEVGGAKGSEAIVVAILTLPSFPHCATSVLVPVIVLGPTSVSFTA